MFFPFLIKDEKEKGLERALNTLLKSKQSGQLVHAAFLLWYAGIRPSSMESVSDSSSEEYIVSPDSLDAADVAKASIAKYYTNMFQAMNEREKRYPS